MDLAPEGTVIQDNSYQFFYAQEMPPAQDADFYRADVYDENPPNFMNEWPQNEGLQDDQDLNNQDLNNQDLNNQPESDETFGWVRTQYISALLVRLEDALAVARRNDLVVPAGDSALNAVRHGNQYRLPELDALASNLIFSLDLILPSYDSDASKILFTTQTHNAVRKVITFVRIIANENDHSNMFMPNVYRQTVRNYYDAQQRAILLLREKKPLFLRHLDQDLRQRADLSLTSAIDFASSTIFARIITELYFALGTI